MCVKLNDGGLNFTLTQGWKQFWCFMFKITQIH